MMLWCQGCNDTSDQDNALSLEKLSGIYSDALADGTFGNHGFSGLTKERSLRLQRGRELPQGGSAHHRIRAGQGRRPQRECLALENDENLLCEGDLHPCHNILSE